MNDKQISSTETQWNNPLQNIPVSEQRNIPDDYIPAFEECEPIERTIFFDPRKSDRIVLRRAFAGEPLAFVQDPQTRTDMNYQISKQDNPDEQRKRWALAAYFSFASKQDIRFCYDNIEPLIKRYHGGETLSIAQAYQNIGTLLNGDPAERSFGERAWGGLISGAGEVANGTFSVLAFLGKLATTQAAYEMKGHANATGNPEVAEKIPEPIRLGEQEESKIRQIYNKHYRPIKEWGDAKMALPENWATKLDSVADWAMNFSIATINYLPQLAAQTGITIAGGGIPALTAIYGINGYYDIKDDHPEATELEAVLYAIGIGMINGGLEKITAGIIKGDVSKEIVKKELARGLRQALIHYSKQYGIASLKEGGQEFAEQFFENLLNIGREMYYNKTDDWKTSDYINALRSGTWESLVLGGVTGGPLSLPGTSAERRAAVTAAEHDRRAQQMRRAVEQELSRLGQLENLSDAEAMILEELSIIDDAGSSTDLEYAADRAAGLEELYKGEYDADADFAPEATDAEIRTADRAARLVRMAERLPHNPEDSIDRIMELQQQFDVPVEAVSEFTAADLADHISRMQKIYPDMSSDAIIARLQQSIEGVWTVDENGRTVVKINVNTTRPNRIPFVLAHEISGHEGLDRLFGSEAKNALLDVIWHDRHTDPVMQKIIEEYHLGEIEEDGSFEDISEADRRIAAEEYLARLGETFGKTLYDIYFQHQEEITQWQQNKNFAADNRPPEQLAAEWMAETGFKPEKSSWFRQLLARVRLWLREHNFIHHLNDDDIAAILVRSAKAAQKKRKSARNGDVRYAAALRRDGDPNNAEGKNKLVDGAVPYAQGFMEWAGLKGKNLYADYEFLYSRHHRYFNTPQEAKAAVELVLAMPEQVADIGKNLSFVGKDKVTGDIYRIEINPNVSGRANHVRSVFKIDTKQYDKVKLTPPRVLQPSKTALQDGRAATMALASSIDNITAFDQMSSAEANSGKQSVDPEVSLREQRLVDMIMPFVGSYIDHDGAYYAGKLEERYGTTVEPQEALYLANAAIKKRRQASIQRSWDMAMEFYRQSNEIFDFFMEFSGQSTLNPGKKYEGEEFTGTFISEAYRKYSVKERQGKRTDRQYRAYLERRERALENADGTTVEEVAAAYARHTGCAQDAAEAELVELLRHLNRNDIRRAYSDFKKENLAMEKHEIEMVIQEHREYMQQLAENTAAEVMENGEGVITEEWVENNFGAYEILYRMIVDENGKAPRIPGKALLENLNAAIAQQTGESKTYFAARKEAKAAAQKEFTAKLVEFRKAVRNKRQSAVTLQREIMNSVRKNLPEELHARYAKRILGLVKIEDDLRRLEAFDQIMHDVAQDAGSTRKTAAIKEIHDILDRNRTRRTDKNVPFSPMRDRQAALDRIRTISRMNPETVAIAEAYAAERLDILQQQLDAIADNPERLNDSEALEQQINKVQHEIFYLRHYGNLQYKTPAVVNNSLAMLERFVRAGRDEFKAEMDARKQAVRESREKLRSEIAAGDLTVPHRNDLDLSINAAREYLLASESTTQLLRDFSRITDAVDFEKSEHGRLLRAIERATQTEATFKRTAQAAIDRCYKECGLTSLSQIGKFINSLGKIADTDIEVPAYAVNKSSAINKENKYASAAYGRPVTHALITLEHARKILEDINSGKNITGIVLPGDLEGSKQIRKALKDVGIDAARHFTLVQQADGGFRAYTENAAGEVVYFAVPDAARQFIRETIKGNPVFPLDAIAVASGQAQIADFDTGAELTGRPDYGDDVDNAAMKAYFDGENGSGTRKIRLVAAAPGEVVGTKKLSITPAAMVQLILTAEQEHYRANMEFNGFDEKVIGQMRAYLEEHHPNAIKLGYALRDIVQSQREQLDAAVFERYGVHLPDVGNFWYADFGSSVKEQVRDPGFGNHAGGMTVTANFLTARKFHTKPVATNSNFLSIFMRKQLETAHFVAWSSTIRELRAVYGDIEVQNKLIEQQGYEAWKILKERLELMASGGDHGGISTAILDYIHKTFYPANVALNISSVVKQLAGGTAYALYVPPTELIKRLPLSRDNKQYNRFINDPRVVEYLQNRVAGGFDPYLQSTLTVARKKKATPAADAIVEKSMFFTLASDKLSATFFGFAAYDYFYAEGIKRGMPDAHDFAVRMWMRATDETQQSGYLKDRNTFNALPGGFKGAMRIFTAYMTSPMQQLGLELSSIRRYMKDHTPEARSEMIRRILINHFVTPTLMNLITSAIRHGINFGDYLEDWENFVVGWIFGQLDALFVVGTMGRFAVNTVTDGFAAAVSAMPILDALSRDYRKISSDLTGRSRVDWLDYMQAAGDALMTAGPAASRTAGGLLYVLSREVRRWRRWFFGEEDQKRRRRRR